MAKFLEGATPCVLLAGPLPLLTLVIDGGFDEPLLPFQFLDGIKDGSKQSLCCGDPICNNDYPYQPPDS